ncbi:hypothetical protein ACIP1X_19585 [Pseudomonas sp. NPDC088885]|uniref:hypothetical protein n=1 Tax=Pseudomonas sp. NPDC088885 TaxID=3364457 RepID=UPI0037FA71BD
MKGTFKRYDEKTGEGIITPDPLIQTGDNDGTGRKNVRENFSSGEEDLLNVYDRQGLYEFSFIIPPNFANKTNIKKGMVVEFDRVSEGSMEATNLRY